MELKELIDHETGSVMAHSEKVRRIVVYLAESFQKSGISVDGKLLEKAAILHDVFKPIEFSDDRFWKKVRDKFGTDHEQAAYDFFKESDPKLAAVIRAHKYSHILLGFSSWEEKILYYADKRVEWDRIVDLKTRLCECHKRYSHLNKTKQDEELINEIDSAIQNLEIEIFDVIDEDPSVLNELNGKDHV